MLGDILIVILAVLYVAASILAWRDYRKKPKRLTEADFAELEQLIKNYETKRKGKGE